LSDTCYATISAFLDASFSWISSMKLNAADVLRKALVGSTLTTRYRLTLDRMKIHSMLIQGDWLIVDVDGDLSVKQVV
jgi:hypothetical protein